jgi:hypothetical protein
MNHGGDDDRWRVLMAGVWVGWRCVCGSQVENVPAPATAAAAAASAKLAKAAETGEAGEAQDSSCN